MPTAHRRLRAVAAQHRLRHNPRVILKVRPGVHACADDSSHVVLLLQGVRRKRFHKCRPRNINGLARSDVAEGCGPVAPIFVDPRWRTRSQHASSFGSRKSTVPIILRMQNFGAARDPRRNVFCPICRCTNGGPARNSPEPSVIKRGRTSPEDTSPARHPPAHDGGLAAECPWRS